MSDTTVQICLTVQICGHSPTRDNQVPHCIHIKNNLAVRELNINVEHEGFRPGIVAPVHRILELTAYTQHPLSSIKEPRHEISNNVVCATSKGSDQPAHTRRLIRAIASR